MITMTETKKKELIKILGRELAEQVIGQAAQAEKSAQASGIRYKAVGDSGLPFAPRDYNTRGGIGVVLRG